MDFIRYAISLINKAILNPIGGFTAFWFVVTLFMPWLEKRMKKPALARLNKYRVTLLLCLVIVSLIIGSYVINSNETSNRPILTFSSATFSNTNDTTAQTVTSNINFNIKNIGGSAAYQVFSRVCWAPANNLPNIHSYADTIDTNPMQPQDTRTALVNISQALITTSGTNEVESDVWYIYYQIKYSNSPNGGKWYSDEYWFALDINTSINSLPVTEKQAFQPFVNTFYSK